MGEDCERTALERRKPAPRTPRRARPAPVPWEARVLLDEIGELCLWAHSGPVDLEGGHRPRLAAPSRVLPGGLKLQVRPVGSWREDRVPLAGTSSESPPL